MAFYFRRLALCASVPVIVAAVLVAGCASERTRVSEAGGRTVREAEPSPPQPRVEQVEEAPAQAEEPAQAGAAELPTPPAREIDAKADPILRQMCDTLDGARSLRFHVNAAMDGQVETGQLAQFHRVGDVAVVKPDRMQASTDSSRGKLAAWYDGKTLTVLDKDANEYATQGVPDRIGEMLDFLADQYGLVMPMADLLVDKTYDSLVANVDSGSYVGLHTVNNVPCHHLLFRQENIDWQIWIDAGKQALPRKLVITYLEQPGEPQFVATMDNWDLDPALSDDLFTFTPPAGAENIPMAELVSERAEVAGR
jgi:hypothetical protein